MKFADGAFFAVVPVSLKERRQRGLVAGLVGHHGMILVSNASWIDGSWATVTEVLDFFARESLVLERFRHVVRPGGRTICGEIYGLRAERCSPKPRSADGLRIDRMVARLRQETAIAASRAEEHAA